jgi:predicted membrane channel-forming protein YqfA (hemolysin III family)
MKPCSGTLRIDFSLGGFIIPAGTPVTARLDATGAVRVVAGANVLFFGVVAFHSFWPQYVSTPPYSH